MRWLLGMLVLAACGGGGEGGATAQERAEEWVAADQQEIEPNEQECAAEWMVRNLSDDEFEQYVSSEGDEVLALPRFDEFFDALTTCMSGT